MRRTGIYGGTFNPIHKGHLHILMEFYQRLKLDRVLVVPTRVPPHKQARDLASVEDRLAMCRLAVEDLPICAEVSDLEIRRKEKSYTADTIQELRNMYPEDALYLLMGEDMFLTVQDWFHPEVIFQNAVICASPRSKDGLTKLKEHGERIGQVYPMFRYVVEDIPYWPLSSTQVRENDKSLRDEVPEKVAAYIESHGLYGL